MLEELKKIDVSMLDALSDLKRERDTLRQRLVRLGEAGAQANEAVLRRVRNDYESRLAAIDERARELEKTARASYAALKPLQQSAQQAYETQRLDEQELELRHQLGEFDDAEYRDRVARLGEGRRVEEDGLAEIAALVARFEGAFDSPEDLDPSSASRPGATVSSATPPPIDLPDENDHTWVTPPEPPPAPAPPPLPVVIRAEVESLAPDDAAPAVPAEIETAQAGVVEAGVGGPAQPPPPAETGTAGARPRLQALDGEIDPPEFALEPLTFIGRTPENQVRIYKPAVSRRHAQIASTAEGWMLRDLSSENGTYVNGQRVTERLLADGDRVQFGTSRFLFKSA